MNKALRKRAGIQPLPKSLVWESKGLKDRILTGESESGLAAQPPARRNGVVSQFIWLRKVTLNLLRQQAENRLGDGVFLATSFQYRHAICACRATLRRESGQSLGDSVATGAHEKLSRAATGVNRITPLI